MGHQAGHQRGLRHVHAVLQGPVGHLPVQVGLDGGDAILRTVDDEAHGVVVLAEIGVARGLVDVAPGIEAADRLAEQEDQPRQQRLRQQPEHRRPQESASPAGLRLEHQALRRPPGGQGIRAYRRRRTPLSRQPHDLGMHGAGVGCAVDDQGQHATAPGLQRIPAARQPIEVDRLPVVQRLGHGDTGHQRRVAPAPRRVLEHADTAALEHAEGIARRGLEAADPHVAAELAQHRHRTDADAQLHAEFACGEPADPRQRLARGLRMGGRHHHHRPVAAEQERQLRRGTQILQCRDRHRRDEIHGLVLACRHQGRGTDDIGHDQFPVVRRGAITCAIEGVAGLCQQRQSGEEIVAAAGRGVGGSVHGRGHRNRLSPPDWLGPT